MARGRPRNAEPPREANPEIPVGANPQVPNFANTEERQRAMDQMLWTLGAAYQRQVQREEAQAQAAAQTNPAAIDYLSLVNKYQPPTYAGQEDPTKLEGWIRAFDKLLDAVNCPEDRKVGVSAYYLEDAADEWWRNLPERERTWHQFKEALRGRFYPISIKNAKYEEYVKLVQGRMTVKEYYDKFRELIRFSPDANASDREIAQKFEFGLNPYIREAFGGKQFDSL